jgi:hypothetical protein
MGGGRAGVGWKPGSFLRSYAANGDMANEMTLDASPVAVLKMLALPVMITATNLLAMLDELADERTRRLKSWPKAESFRLRPSWIFRAGIRGFTMRVRVRRRPKAP